MSPHIQVGLVWSVLLADGWHEVAPSEASPIVYSSFEIDAYTYVDGTGLVVAGDNAPGFAFSTPDDREIRGPLTAILAVDTHRSHHV